MVIACSNRATLAEKGRLKSKHKCISLCILHLAQKNTHKNTNIKVNNNNNLI